MSPSHRPRPSAPPLSKQPFFLFCFWVGLVHLVVFGAIFWSYKDRAAPLVDEETFYGNRTLDLATVLWVSPSVEAPAAIVASTPLPEPAPIPEPTPAIESSPTPALIPEPVRPTELQPVPMDPKPVIATSETLEPGPFELPEITLDEPAQPETPAASYETALLERYVSKWNPPELDRRLVVKAEVIVGQDGRILRSRIIEPSKHFLMDQSVGRALDAVIRAEALPEELAKPDYRAVLTFTNP